VCTIIIPKKHSSQPMCEYFSKKKKKLSHIITIHNTKMPFSTASKPVCVCLNTEMQETRRRGLKHAPHNAYTTPNPFVYGYSKTNPISQTKATHNTQHTLRPCPTSETHTQHVITRGTTLPSLRPDNRPPALYYICYLYLYCQTRRQYTATQTLYL